MAEGSRPGHRRRSGAERPDGRPAGRISTPPGRSYHGACRPDPRDRDEPHRPQQQGLAQSLGDVCHLRDDPRGRGRRLRPAGHQRQAPARPEGNDQRIRACYYEKSTGARPAAQGPARRTLSPRAHGLRQALPGTGRDGPRRAGPRGHPSDLRQVRRDRHRLGRLPLPGPQQHPPRDSPVPRAQPREPGVAAPDHAERPSRSCASHVRRGLRLWPPTAPARPDGHRGTHPRRQLGPDGAVEGPEARLPAGLHHLGALPGKSRMLAPASLQSRLQGEPPQRLRAAHRPHRLRQLRPSPQDGSIGREREGLLRVRPAPLRGDRTDVFRPQGRARSTTS